MKTEKYISTINDLKNMEVSTEDAKSLDVLKLSKDNYNIIYKGSSVNVKLIDFDPSVKEFVFGLEEELIHVKLKDVVDQAIEKMGYSSNESSNVKEVKAPMPGLVLSIMVKEGEVIEKGDNLLILEAMKMENIIKSQSDNTIAKILVSPGDKVEKNQILMEME